MFRSDLGQMVVEFLRGFRRHPRRSTALLVAASFALIFAAAILIGWLRSLLGATGVILAIFLILTGLGTLLSMAIEAYDAELIGRAYEEEEMRR
jgi:hypothetical protein